MHNLGFLLCKRLERLERLKRLRLIASFAPSLCSQLLPLLYQQKTNHLGVFHKNLLRTFAVGVPVFWVEVAVFAGDGVGLWSLARCCILFQL